MNQSIIDPSKYGFERCRPKLGLNRSRGKSNYCIIHHMEEKSISPIVQKCKESLSRYYGSKLKGVILYGSLARGEAGSASDIDLLVLLAPPFDFFAELRQIVDLLYPIQLESEQLISAKPALASDYEVGSISLYRNARKEGVPV